MGERLIEIQGLRKEFRLGLRRRRVEAVRGIDLEVRAGEAFGFLGPNGAGKTTTIKMLMGLIFPTAGTATLFGVPVPAKAAMARVGFLPENPYVYPYLTPREFVIHCGRLSGVRGAALRDRASQVLSRVGVLYAADRPVKKLSKGMVQRVGIAAALVADPELLILDEPMSGLDPVGRKEVRDLMLEERRAGRTVFFSTHILTDVETLCDRVAILRRGQVVVEGALGDLLRERSQGTELVFDALPDALIAAWQADSALRLERVSERWLMTVDNAEAANDLLRCALGSGARLLEMRPRHETLEDLFVRQAL